MSFRDRPKHGWWLPYLEAVGGILLLTGFFLKFYGISSLVLPRFHPFLPLVLLIAARYGFLPGVFSALVGILDYYLLLLWQDHWDSLLSGDFSFLWPSAFLFSGMIVGELRDAEARRFNDLETQFLKEKDAARTATLQVDILIKAKKELEKRVFMDPNLATDLFDVFRSLEKDQIDSISATLISICISFVGADSVGLYRRDRDTFSLEASSGIVSIPDRVGKSYLPFFRVYSTRKAMTIREDGALPELDRLSGKVRRPLCIYPVLSGDHQVEFLLVIWHAPFEKLTPDFFQMMRLVVDRASSRIEFLESQKRTLESVSIDAPTGFLRAVFFARRASEELNKSHRYHAPISFLKISFASASDRDLEPESALSVVREIVKRLLRDVDFAGLTGDRNEVYLCLPHTADAGAQVVRTKFLALWNQLLPSYRLLENVILEVELFSFPNVDGDHESDGHLYHSLMMRLDSLFLQDPSTGFYSGEGFIREFQKEKSLAEGEGASLGILRLLFTTPSWDDVVAFGKALAKLKNQEGQPLFLESVFIGIPLSGNSLFLLVPKADSGFMEMIGSAIGSLWTEIDIPRLKRGSFSMNFRSLAPNEFLENGESLDDLMKSIGWIDGRGQ